MFQRDYFMRMIEQITTTMGHVMGHRQRREHLEALAVIDELLDREFRLNAKLIQSLSEKDLMDMLTTNGATDFASLQAIALLLREKGEILADKGEDTASYAALRKSLNLFIRGGLADDQPITADPRQEIPKLIELLRFYELPQDTKKLLVQWHEYVQSFDLAENTLHELLEDGHLTKEEAERFYLGLLQLTDEELAQGGLPREEVAAAREQLIKQGVSK